MVNFYLTKPKGYIVLEKGQSEASFESLERLVGLLKFLEKKDVQCTPRLIETLISLDERDFNEAKNEFKKVYQGVKGQFFRDVFATSENIDNEKFTIVDLINQINHYLVVYGLGEVDYGVHYKKTNRKVEGKGDKRKVKQDLNNSFTIIDVKNLKEFSKEVKTLVELPIVIGEQQLQLIKEADKEKLLTSILASTDFKVKENMFAIIDIVGKDRLSELNIFKTPTDLLRYAMWCQGDDFRDLKPKHFHLKTSEKRVIMNSLNKMGSKNFIGTYEEMNRNKKIWIALGQNMHPGSKKYNKYSVTQDLFNHIRNGSKLDTYSNKLQQALNNKNYSVAIPLLVERPGELVRRIDLLIRNTNNEDFDILLEQLKKVNLNPKLILQVKSWISYRKDNALNKRIFNIKGKLKEVDKPLDALDADRVKKVKKVFKNSIKKALKDRVLFKTKNIIAEEVENV